jgi:hypothetical protein
MRFLTYLRLVLAWTNEYCNRNIQNTENRYLCDLCITPECYSCAEWSTASKECYCFNQIIRPASMTCSSPGGDDSNASLADELKEEAQNSKILWVHFWYLMGITALMSFSCVCGFIGFRKRRSSATAQGKPVVWVH